MFNVNENDLKLILALLSSSFFGYIVKDIYLEIRNWIKSKTEDPFSRILPKIHEIYQIISILLNQLDAKNILIIKAENCGSTPKLDNRINGTVIYEVYDNNMTPIKPQFQKEELDPEYLKILFDLDQKDKIELNVWELNNSILKSILGINKITKFLIFKIAKSDKKFYHMLISYENNFPEFSKYEEELILFSIRKLKNLLLSEEVL